jgi:hypothetical protein
MSVCPVSGSTSTSQIWQPAGNVKLVGSLVDAVVDGFRHGMIGEEKLKQDPVVNISTTVNHSKDVVIQNAVGDNNRQSVEQRSLLDALDKLLGSQEFKNLTEQNRLAIQDMVDVLRSEVTKQDAEQDKVGRWGSRLIELLKQVGLHTAAHTITHLLFAAADAPAASIPL